MQNMFNSPKMSSTQDQGISCDSVARQEAEDTSLAALTADLHAHNALETKKPKLKQCILLNPTVKGLSYRPCGEAGC